MNPDLVDKVDDLSETNRALRAVIGLMMPQRNDNLDGLDHVDRNDLALLLGMIHQQFAADVATARSLVINLGQAA